MSPAAAALRLRTLVVAVALLATGAASAQGWTVQTVAVRDLREARSVAADLVRSGFDAYTEFSMDGEGRQWVRVRAGCYATRGGAEGLASALRGRVTRDAVVVRRTPNARARGCVTRDIGFNTPSLWTQPEPGVATFVVEVAGVQGVMRFTSAGWRLMQEPATEALAPGTVGDPRFVQVDAATRPHVRVRHADGDLFVCPGRLLAQTDAAAIVHHGDVVLACLWEPPQGPRATETT